MNIPVSKSWRPTKLKFAARVIAGGTPESSNPEFWDGSVPWLTPVDLGNERNDAITFSRRTLTEAGVKAAGLERLPAGSIVISTRAPIGSVGLLACEAVTNQGCKALVLDHRALDARFSFYLALDSTETLQSLGLGTTFAELSTYALKNLAVSLPVPVEQRRIAQYLDKATGKIDRLVALRRRQMELLHEQRRALIQQVVTRGPNPSVVLTNSRDPSLGTIPKHWEAKEIRHLVPRDRQVMYGIVLPGPNVDEGVPIVKAGNCEPGRLSIEFMHRTTFEIESGYVRSRLRADDIVYAIRGSFGQAEIVPPELEGANLTQDAARIAPRNGIHGRWLWYAVRSEAFFVQMNSVAVGATIRGVNIRDLKRGKVAVPPLVEQKAIAAFLDEEGDKSDRLLTAYARQIDLLTEYRAALIHECVTGQRPVSAA